MNLLGEPISAAQAYEVGLANEVVPDHELFDTALAWARKLGGQAPVAVEQIKKVSANGDLDEGIEAEKGGFADCVRLRGRARGDLGLPRQAQAEVVRASRTSAAEELAGAHSRRASARSSRSPGPGISVPSGIPDFRTPGTGLWEKVDPMAVATIDAFHRDTSRFWDFYRPRFHDAGGQAAEPGPRGAGRARAPGPARRGDHPEHRPPSPQGGLGARDRGARLDRDRELHELRRQLPARAGGVAVRRGRGRDLHLLRRQGEAGRGAVRGAPARGRDGARREQLLLRAPTCCSASAPRSRSIRWPACPG